jgi:hypothetical protein
MEKVQAFQFTKYDIMSDTKRLSRRYGTIEAINKIGGEVILEPAIEINASYLESDFHGLTKIGFEPSNMAE